ncbi:HXXEE domain-containing protein [Enterococcus sp. LJL99]
MIEEFFLLGLVTILCYFYSQYNIYIAIIIGYGIHVIGHVAQALYLKKYAPTLSTGIISTIVMFILIKNTLVEVDTKMVLILIIPLTILIFFNLFLFHRYAKL